MCFCLVFLRLNTVIILFASSCYLCNFKSDPGLVILTILKHVKIDVEKMEEEKLLPEDGKNNCIEYILKFLFSSLHSRFSSVM